MTHFLRLHRPVIAGIVVASLLIDAPAVPQTSPDAAREFLTKHARLSKSDLSDLERGKPVAEILDNQEPSEVAPFGVIEVRVPAEHFAGKIRDIVQFKQGKEVQQIGTFQATPRLEDLQALSLDSDEVKSLRDCTVGGCSMKLTKEMILRLQQEVKWTGENLDVQVNDLFRRMLVDYVSAYLVTGNSALAEYVDKGTPVRLAEEFSSILKRSPYLEEYVPALANYLRQFPRERPDGIEEVVYWSKEKFATKPVVSVTHLMIYRVSREGTTSIVVASKQIYANHYFTGSLGLSALATRSADGKSANFLMYLNRSRFDILGGFLGFLKRWILRRRVVGGLEENLRAVRDRLEAGYVP